MMAHVCEKYCYSHGKNLGMPALTWTVDCQDTLKRKKLVGIKIMWSQNMVSKPSKCNQRRMGGWGQKLTLPLCFSRGPGRW